MNVTHWLNFSSFSTVFFICLHQDFLYFSLSIKVSIWMRLCVCVCNFLCFQPSGMSWQISVWTLLSLQPIVSEGTYKYSGFQNFPSVSWHVCPLYIYTSCRPANSFKCFVGAYSYNRKYFRQHFTICHCIISS